MSTVTMTIVRTPDDDEPRLFLDGEEVAPDSRITIRADELARVIYHHLNAGVDAGSKIARGTLPPTQPPAPIEIALQLAWPDGPVPTSIVSMPTRLTSRRVVRDDAGLIQRTEDVEEDAPGG